MRPAFSNALYYPSIDIRDTNWLKTAILFWDSISTIVPEDLDQPYVQPDTQYLADIGFLKPLYVNSDDRSVVGIENDIIKLLNSPKFKETFFTANTKKYGGKLVSERSYGVREPLKNLPNSGIYSKKMSWKIQDEIRYLSKNLEKNEIYYLDNELAYIYMIVLANKLCEDHSLGMVTDHESCFKAGNTVKYGHRTGIRPEDRFRSRRPKDHQLEQGLLLNLIISSISISPNTNLKDLVSFRNHHKDELGRFRTQLAAFTQNFVEEKPIEIMQQEVNDLYINEFLPALNSFKAALTSSKIKWITDNLLKVSLFNASATGVPMALLGMPLKNSIFAGVGVSMMASIVSCNVDKKTLLQENPYSYLLSIERELS